MDKTLNMVKIFISFGMYCVLQKTTNYSASGNMDFIPVSA